MEGSSASFPAEDAQFSYVAYVCALFVTWTRREVPVFAADLSLSSIAWISSMASSTSTTMPLVALGKSGAGSLTAFITS